MRRFVLVTASVFFFAAPLRPSGATENPVSSYTRQLIELAKLFAKLNETIASQIADNERLLMAEAMVRLSGGFYDLKIHKQQFVDAVTWSVVHQSPPPDMAQKTMNLKDSLDCLTAQLNDKGARIGALVGYHGMTVEKQLRMALNQKLQLVDELVKELGLDPSTPNLLEAIENDGQAAEDAAQTLYEKTNEFAHVLNPSVLPPINPHVCTYPPEL